MSTKTSNSIFPRRVRLETTTACQLKCPSCPTASGETGKSLGVGFLKFEDFKRFVDAEPEVSHIEISNWGEIFLNNDIVRILKYANKRHIVMTAGNGVNLNTVRPEALEAVVRYKLRFMICSIDRRHQWSGISKRTDCGVFV
jgi:MoaA/NifB/PqqE/SkfB family radical SAM enzyme